MTVYDEHRGRSVWLTIGAAWGAILLILTVWLLRTPPPLLREQLKSLQFWSLEACVVAVITCVVLVFREIREQIPREHLWRLAGIIALAVLLTVFVAPRTNRIFYDEQIYQSIGQSLTDTRRAEMCLDGSVEYGRLECAAGEYNKQPYAYPHLLSVAYRIAGPGPAPAFVVNAAAMAFTVVAVYLLVLLLFEDGLSALFAALIIALTPHQLLWSATAAVEPLASLTCVAALVMTGIFLKTRTTVALAATAVTTAYAIQFRPESVLIVPVILLLLVVFARDEFTRPRLWAVAALGLALVAVHLAHMFAVRNEGWGTTNARFSFEYVRPNLDVNGRFYVADERFPVIYTVLAVVGLSATGLVARKLSMVLYFSLFFGTGLLFYAGSYDYGADVRYSLMTYPPLAVLAGLGAGQAARYLGRWSPGRRAGQVVLGGLMFQFLWYLPLVRATTEEAWAARADVEFAESVAPSLPPNSYVLTHNPGMFHLWGVNAGQMFTVLDNPARLYYLNERYAGGVFLHWNFWCNVADPVQQDLCRKVAAMTPGELLREQHVRDQRFAFVRLPAPAAHKNAPDEHASNR